MRLFFALPLSDDARRALAGLRCDVGKARWVPPEQLHVTIRFLGEVGEESARRVIERVERASAAWPRLRIAVRGLGTFGSHRPRVLWAGLDRAEEVRRIAADVEACVRDAGLPPEERAFTAHVTLARLTRPSKGALRALLERGARLATDAFDVPELILYRSTLSDRGAVHDPLHRFAIGPRE